MYQPLLYALIVFFLLIYFLRALLFAGYESLNYKTDMKKTGIIAKLVFNKIMTLKPILQIKLPGKGVDHKIHQRFQKKAWMYYWLLWASLFAILFLAANIYLNAFED